MNLEINLLAVLLAAVAFMGVGFLWYTMLFSKLWMNLKGYTAESMKNAQSQMGMGYVLSTALALVTAYVLSYVVAVTIEPFGYAPVVTGILAAFWLWLGLVMPVQATATLYSEKKRWALFALDTGYQLVGLLAMGLIIGLLR